MEQELEKIYFTVLHPETGAERRIFISYDEIPENPVEVMFYDTRFVIDRQQLMELASLFLAIAGVHVDFDSASELLDGFNLRTRGKVAAKVLGGELDD